MINSQRFQNLKVYTCTPIDFAGDESFFSRESGMFCRGLRSIGVKSMAIMPGPARSGDDSLLIRTEPKNLIDSEWWKSHKLDAVILYSWAAPRYTRIAAAIKKASIPLMVCMDTCGVISPHANCRAWFYDLPKRIFLEKKLSNGKIRDIAKYIVESLASPIARARIHHYQYADIVTAPTPDAAEWVRCEALSLGNANLASKVRYLPHPQSLNFNYDGTPKERLVITIARWQPEDWPQKNPRVLVEAYRRFLEVNREWRGKIVGTGATRLLERLGVPPVCGLEFLERVHPSEVSTLFNRASIGFWSSRWEGQQGTGAQALCCGCSVVSHDSPMMSCFRHYVSRGSGSLAESNTPEHLSNALTLEANAWEMSSRSQHLISKEWVGEFHANSVALKAIGYLKHVLSRGA